MSTIRKTSSEEGTPNSQRLCSCGRSSSSLMFSWVFTLHAGSCMSHDSRAWGKDLEHSYMQSSWKDPCAWARFSSNTESLRLNLQSQTRCTWSIRLLRRKRRTLVASPGLCLGWFVEIIASVLHRCVLLLKFITFDAMYSFTSRSVITMQKLTSMLVIEWITSDVTIESQSGVGFDWAIPKYLSCTKHHWVNSNTCSHSGHQNVPTSWALTSCQMTKNPLMSSTCTGMEYCVCNIHECMCATM